MKAKMVLFLFVMGVILGGCSVKSNKDILLDLIINTLTIEE